MQATLGRRAGVFFLALTAAVSGQLWAAKEEHPDRRYFERCSTAGIVKIKQGMSRAEARGACSGFEFPASESLEKGFVFAADSKRSASVRIPGWLPARDQRIDFFCSRQVVVMAYYSADGLVDYVTRFPLHSS